MFILEFLIQFGLGTFLPLKLLKIYLCRLPEKRVCNGVPLRSVRSVSFYHPFPKAEIQRYSPFSAARTQTSEAKTFVAPRKL